MVTRAFPSTTPYLIAAIDYNHNGSATLARRLVRLAAEAGAHAVKFSMRRVLDTMAPEVLDTPWLGQGPLGRTHREVWTRLELSHRAFAGIRRAAKGSVDFVVAPGNLEAFVAAQRLDPDVYQIDPPALGNVPLLRAIARTGRPVLLIAGMCTEATVAEAVRVLKKVPLAIVHMVCAVPLPPGETALAMIPRLRDRFRMPVGYAGWEPGIAWCLVASALGAVVIEKPFTLDHQLGGPFHSFSLDPTQLRNLAQALRDTTSALAPVNKRRPLAIELDVLGSSGQSLVARRRLREGTVLKLEDFTTQAPLRGVSPRLWQWLVGRRLLYDIEQGEPITFGMIE